MLYVDFEVLRVAFKIFFVGALFHLLLSSWFLLRGRVESKMHQGGLVLLILSVMALLVSILKHRTIEIADLGLVGVQFLLSIGLLVWSWKASRTEKQFGSFVSASILDILSNQTLVILIVFAVI
jgi:asparagine N-glycosylation enzyme membrane subunit Stt3